LIIPKEILKGVILSEAWQDKFSEDSFYSHYYQKALTIGEHFCHKSHIAQEIAQLTTIKLFLWKERVEKPDKWVYQVARNFSLQMLDRLKSDTEFLQLIGAVSEAENYPDLIDHPNLEKIISEIPPEIFCESDRELARDYYVQEKDAGYLAEIYNLSEDSIIPKLYNIRQEIILYIKFTGNFKIICKVPGTKLNRNIMYLIEKLKQSLETQDFREVGKYLDSDKHLDSLKTARIVHKVHSYELSFLNPGLYRLNAIYLLENNVPYVISIDIQLADWKRIRIVSDFKFCKKIVKISREEVDDNIRRLKLRKHNGELLLSKEEILEIIDKTKHTLIEI
jgi:hypothetical protein